MNAREIDHQGSAGRVLRVGRCGLILMPPGRLGRVGGTPWNWRDVRWTGVLQKIAGRWVMMQQHFSKAEDTVRAEVMEEMRKESTDDE